MKSKKYTHILFDLDGTLTDSAEGIINCVVYALEQMEMPVPERDKLYELIGPPITLNFHEHLGLSEEDTVRAVKLYRERYGAVGLFENKLFGGIREMLERLTGEGYILAVATGKPEPFSVRILEHFGLDGYFMTVSGSSLDSTREKKSEIIEEALRRMKITDKSCTLMVGDRKYDAMGASEAGLRCIGAGWGFADEGELEASGVLATASSPEALADMLTGGAL